MSHGCVWFSDNLVVEIFLHGSNNGLYERMTLSEKDLLSINCWINRTEWVYRVCFLHICELRRTLSSFMVRVAQNDVKIKKKKEKVLSKETARRCP